MARKLTCDIACCTVLTSYDWPGTAQFYSAISTLSGLLPLQCDSMRCKLCQSDGDWLYVTCTAIAQVVDSLMYCAIANIVHCDNSKLQLYYYHACATSAHSEATRRSFNSIHVMPVRVAQSSSAQWLVPVAIASGQLQYMHE
jgi:hypothetical protein